MMRRLSKTFPSVKHPNPSKLLPSVSIKSEANSPSKSKPRSWSVYLILSTNTPIKTYVGVTTDFSRRLKQHNGKLKGGAKASCAGRPWICACLIHGFKDQGEGGTGVDVVGWPFYGGISSSMNSFNKVFVDVPDSSHPSWTTYKPYELVHLNQSGKFYQEVCLAKERMSTR